MEIIYECCAGLDVHQNNVVVCVLDGPLTSTRPKKHLKKFDTTTKGLLGLQNLIVKLLLWKALEFIGNQSGIFSKGVLI